MAQLPPLDRMFAAAAEAAAAGAGRGAAVLKVGRRPGFNVKILWDTNENQEMEMGMRDKSYEMGGWKQKREMDESTSN
jgi:hypothetical protein